MSLAGRKVLVTRQREQSIEITRILEAHGAQVEVVPYIETVALPIEWPAMDTFKYLVLTSANTVRILEKERRFVPEHVAVVAVGEKTAASVREWLPGRNVFVPSRFDGTGILNWFESQQIDMTRARVLSPHARQAKATFVEPLRALGAYVETLELYTIEMCKREKLPDASITDVLFFSGRTIDSFFLSHESALEYLNIRSVAVIGPNTRQHAEKLGIHSVICPSNPELNLLIDALVARVGGNSDDSAK